MADISEFDLTDSVDLDGIIMDDSCLYCYKCDSDISSGCDRHKIEWIVNKSIECSFNSTNNKTVGGQIAWRKNIGGAYSSSERCPCRGDEIRHLETGLPVQLAFCRSQTRPNQIDGVRCTVGICKGTIFGPFMGQISPIKTAMRNVFEKSINGYSWLLWRSNSLDSPSIVDAQDCFSANWMRFVNCCHDIQSQNMIAIQYEGLIFYRACQDIPPNSELLVSCELQHEKDVEIAKAKYLIKSEPQSKCDVNHNKSLQQELSTDKLDDILIPNVSEQPLQTDFSHSQIQYNNVINDMVKDEVMLPICLKNSSIFTEQNDESMNHTSVMDSTNQISEYLNYNPTIHNNITNYQTLPSSSNVLIPFNYPEESYYYNNFNSYLYNNFVDQVLQSNSLYNHNLSSSLYNMNMPSVTHVNSTQSFNIYTNEPVPEYHSTIQNFDHFPFLNQSNNLLFDDSAIENSYIDEETMYFIFDLCKSEPYLCVDNIIELLLEHFPEKKHLRNLSLINILKTKIYRLKNKLHTTPDEELISAVVKLYEINQNLSLWDIQGELMKLYPNQTSSPSSSSSSSTFDIGLISEIIKTNFSLGRFQNIEKDVVNFIGKLAKRYPTMLPNEIFSKVLHRFPDRKNISMASIGRALNDLKTKKEKQTLDLIDVQVKKIVHQICYELKERSDV